MQIQLLIPSQNQKKLSVQVERNETVSTFRKIVANVVQVPEKSFLLIAFGKIMLDKSAEKTAATLFSTYRVRHKTCVFVHINNSDTSKSATKTTASKRRKTSKTIIQPKQSKSKQSKQSKLKQSKIQRSIGRRPSATSAPAAAASATPLKAPTPRRRGIIRDNNVLTIPFGDFKCPVCQNNNKLKKCLECGCSKCLYKTGDPLICDQCDNYWHIECAGLTRTPNEQYWFCPDCINKDTQVIIGKGKAVHEPVVHKKQIVIRDIDCVLVPTYHVGKIPGIYCGQSWEYRSLVHDWGIHRASVSSVVGSVYTGAVSVVLSGGLKQDRDDGYEFVFSGAGGDLKIRHRMKVEGQMTEDQQLTRYNKALAITCNAPLNDIEGAKAVDWRKSRPIRVCRAGNRKCTHPTYAPEEGIRYDGLYKIVKYWPHRDKKTGFLIWKFLFRRDDQELPPWMSHGKQIMTKRGIRMIKSNSEKTKKLVKYSIPPRIQGLIAKDTKNERLWDQINKMEFWSEYEFLHYLFETVVTCSSNVCSKPIKDPITTPCGHICCAKCLTTSKTEYCFTCRSKLPPTMKVNDNLTRILQSLNWAYNSSSDCKKSVLPSALGNSLGEKVVDIKKDRSAEDDYDLLHYSTVKQEETEYPTIVSNLAINVNKPKRVRIFIEYLGNDPVKQESVSAGQQHQQISHKKRKLN